MDLILAALTLIDMTLVASLIVMVMLSGYENFVSKLDLEGAEKSLAWLGKLDAGSLKIKVAASIVAISSIHLLKAFMNYESRADREADHAHRHAPHLRRLGAAARRDGPHHPAAPVGACAACDVRLRARIYRPNRNGGDIMRSQIARWGNSLRGADSERAGSRSLPSGGAAGKPARRGGPPRDRAGGRSEYDLAELVGAITDENRHDEIDFGTAGDRVG